MPNRNPQRLSRDQRAKLKQRRADRRRPAHAVSPVVEHGLDESLQLVRRGKLPEALQLLQELHRRYPKDSAVLTALAELHERQNNVAGLQASLEKLCELQPGESELLLAAAGACLRNARPMTACKYFRQFLQTCDQRQEAHPRAAEVCELVPRLAEMFGQKLSAAQLADGDDIYDLGLLHEEVQSHLDRGKFDLAQETAHRLLARWPRFTPALNNLTLACFCLGRIEAAVAAARRALEIDPDNVHALANLCRLLALTAGKAAAQETAERLKALNCDHCELELKQAEALSCCGDDEAVLDALRRAQARAAKQEIALAPLLLHFGAVAAARLGQPKETRALWERVCVEAPYLTVARDNLRDSKRTQSERHGPWPFDFPNLVPGSVVSRLEPIVRTGQRKGDKQMRRQIREFLTENAWLNHMVPFLLERGDAAGRQFAYVLATTTRTPEMLAALQAFAIGPHGPDELRVKALNFVADQSPTGLGPQPMWVRGKQTEVRTMAYRIFNEGRENLHPPDVEDLAWRALQAMRDDDGARAEELLHEALRLAPDARDLWNNLAAAYAAQGKSEESENIVQDLYTRFPDYFFARVNMAHKHAREGRVAEAKEMVKPLLAQRDLHITEFTALASAQVTICFAEREFKAAESWLEMWRKVDPDSPGVERAGRVLDNPILKGLSRLIGRGGPRKRAATSDQTS